MCEFGVDWKVKGKRTGPQSQRDANPLRVSRACTRAKGENAGLAMRLLHASARLHVALLLHIAQEDIERYYRNTDRIETNQKEVSQQEIMGARGKQAGS
jgi:hypothetical protein